MGIEVLGNEKVWEFIDYCKKYRKNIDDSFLYDEDLREFKPDSGNPTYVIVDDGDKIVAAASLIVDEYMKRGKKGRFRILHSSINELRYYQMLLHEILKHTEGLEKVIIFSPIVNKELMSKLEALNFKVERYSYLLVRDDIEVSEVVLPEGYKIKPFEIGKDEEVWCNIRNESFAKLQGNETPVTPEMIVKMNSGDEYIEDGARILYHNEKPVGVVRAAKDEYEGEPIVNIGPLAIIPEYQGKGLGRMLLRDAVSFGREKGYKKTILCVNAENERAKILYVQEGFKQVEAVACYKYEL